MKSLFLLLLIGVEVVTAQNKDVIIPEANLVVKDIPEIPVSIKKGLEKYTESRYAVFEDWHPVNRNMLITTRFANVPQIHIVKTPLGARKQITFYEDAIADATYEPISGNYFLLTKDEGGNEFSQIYRYDLDSGNVTMLTGGKRLQNGEIVWSGNSKRIAYGSTSRNGADRDV